MEPQVIVLSVFHLDFTTLVQILVFHVQQIAKHVTIQLVVFLVILDTYIIQRGTRANNVLQFIGIALNALLVCVMIARMDTIWII